MLSSVVVKQQGSHVAAEGLLLLARLIGCRAGVSCNLGVARALSHSRVIGNCGVARDGCGDRCESNGSRHGGYGQRCDYP